MICLYCTRSQHSLMLVEFIRYFPLHFSTMSFFNTSSAFYSDDLLFLKYIFSLSTCSFQNNPVIFITNFVNLFNMLTPCDIQWTKSITKDYQRSRFIYNQKSGHQFHDKLCDGKTVQSLSPNLDQSLGDSLHESYRLLEQTNLDYCTVQYSNVLLARHQHSTVALQ